MNMDIMMLADLVENEAVDAPLKEVIRILLRAANDWPVPVSSLEDFEDEIARFIGGATTRTGIGTVSAGIDLSKHAWQAESLCQVEEVFQYFPNDMLLMDVIEDIRRRVTGLIPGPVR